MPLEFQSKKPHPPLEFQDAAHGMAWIFSGISKFRALGWLLKYQNITCRSQLIIKNVVDQQRSIFINY